QNPDCEIQARGRPHLRMGTCCRRSRLGQKVCFHAFDLGSLLIGRLFDKKVPLLICIMRASTTNAEADRLAFSTPPETSKRMSPASRRRVRRLETVWKTR